MAKKGLVNIGGRMVPSWILETSAEFLDQLLCTHEAPNFLHNWYFVNPINQKKIFGEIITPGYFIDRWKLVSGTVVVSEQGLVLTGTISQPIEQAVPKNVIPTVLTNSGVYSGVYDQDTKEFKITSSGDTLIAAKLEKGASFEHQTLAYETNDGWELVGGYPNYELELLKCQRYYQLFTSESLRPAMAEDFRPVMRTNPALGTLLVEDTLYYTADANL